MGKVSNIRWLLIAGASLLGMPVLLSCGPHSNLNAEHQAHEQVSVEEAQGERRGACSEIMRSKPNFRPFKITELKSRFLKAHNDIRKLYGVRNLVWDDSLARYAQEWADYLKNNNQCNIKHRSGSMKTKRVGENLAYNWSSRRMARGDMAATPEKGTYAWAKECADFDYGQSSCRKNAVCGHFTQVVWSKSVKLGCGVAVCDEGNGNYRGRGRAEVWVCNYDPAGNVSQIDRFGRRTPLKPY